MRDKKDHATRDLHGLDRGFGMANADLASLVPNQAAGAHLAPLPATPLVRTRPARVRSDARSQQQLDLLDATDCSGLPMWPRSSELDLSGLPNWPAC